MARVCATCSKGFANAAQLTAHKRLHNRDRRYECHGCDQSFTTFGQVVLHIRAAHRT